MTIYRPMQPVQTDDELVSIIDELSHCLKSICTPLGLGFRDRLRLFIVERGLDCDPHVHAELPPKQYAYLELFGHRCLGPCEVREIDHYGVKMCEARPLDKDGEPGKIHRFPGTAIYDDRDLTEEEAKRLAVPRMLPAVSAEPPCKTCGYGVCDCSAAERDGAVPPTDDGTPLCEPIEEGEDDIPF